MPESPSPAGRIVAQVAYGTSISGGERVLLSVVRGLIARGDAVVAVVAGPGPVEDALAAAGAAVRRLDMRKTYDLASARRLAGVLRDAGASVVETHGFLRNLHGRFARRWFGGPPHLGVVHRALGWRRRWRQIGWRDRARVTYYEALDRLSAGASARTLAVSGAVRDELVAAGLDPGAIEVVPNGIPAPARVAPEVAAARRAELGLPPEARLLFTAARLSPLKDLATMIRGAVAAGGWSLAIAGDGPERARLAALIKDLGAGDRVRLLGRREDVGEWLAAADAFGLTSTAGEGLPIALLEAMARGLPAAVTHEPGTLEAARPDETALVVPAGDPAAYAAALGRLRDEPGLATRLGDAARAAYEARFTEARMVAAHLAAIDRAAAGG